MHHSLAGGDGEHYKVGWGNHIAGRGQESATNSPLCLCLLIRFFDLLCIKSINMLICTYSFNFRLSKIIL